MSEKMTQKKFFELLAERANKVAFYVDDECAIREKKSGKCPIRAVATHSGLRTPKHYSNAHWDYFAERLGIAEKFAVDIVDSSDACCFQPKLKLRRKLLVAVGLAQGATK